MTTFTKDPDAVLDYAVDWSAWLVEDDTIADSEWIVPAGEDAITKDDDSFTTTKAIIWLSGGELGAKYDLVNRITTEQGRTEDKTLSIRVREH